VPVTYQRERCVQANLFIMDGSNLQDNWPHRPNYHRYISLGYMTCYPHRPNYHRYISLGYMTCYPDFSSSSLFLDSQSYSSNVLHCPLYICSISVQLVL
jgi:hypothetical protein